jgi:hypothetical protein
VKWKGPLAGGRERGGAGCGRRPELWADSREDEHPRSSSFGAMPCDERPVCAEKRREASKLAEAQWPRLLWSNRTWAGEVPAVDCRGIGRMVKKEGLRSSMLATKEASQRLVQGQQGPWLPQARRFTIGLYSVPRAIYGHPLMGRTRGPNGGPFVAGNGRSSMALSWTVGRSSM